MSGQVLRDVLARRRGLTCAIVELAVAACCAALASVAGWQASLALAAASRPPVAIPWFTLFEERGCAVMARSPVPGDGAPWDFRHADVSGAPGCGRCRACAH